MFGQETLFSLHSPYIEPGNLKLNCEAHLDIIENCDSNIHIFPELSITGYHCGDLFLNTNYLNQSLESLIELHNLCLKKRTLAIVGCPIESNGSLFNCAVIIGLKKIICKGKVELCVAQEYYEERWFDSALKIDNNNPVEFTKNNLEFQLTNTLDSLKINLNNNPINIGIEICEDSWSEICPAMLNDSLDIIVNLSASSDTISSREARKTMIKGISERKKVPYLYVSGSNGESSSISLLSNIHLVYDKSIVYEKHISNEDNLTTSVLVDFQALRAGSRQDGKKSRKILSKLLKKDNYQYKNYKVFNFTCENSLYQKANIHLPNYVKQPFHEELKSSKQKLDEIFKIQAKALRKRLIHTNSKKALLGLSGGIDSAYTLLVIKEACKGLETKPLAIVLPSLGSSEESQNIAIKFADLLDIDTKKIDISNISKISKELISLKTSLANENIQARLRTTLLMTMANDLNGIMVGTGTMSELAIGWCTYNADNMSMYNPNGGLPKTILIDIAKSLSHKFRVNEIINEILNRPYTPELEIVSNSKKIKTTEERIGLYEIIDFCLFYTLKYSISRENAYKKAKELFTEIPEEKIKFSVNSFYDRFIPSQFKRTIVPDSPKIFSFDLSPRGCLRIPSDIKNPF